MNWSSELSVSSFSSCMCISYMALQIFAKWFKFLHLEHCFPLAGQVFLSLCVYLRREHLVLFFA